MMPGTTTENRSPILTPAWDAATRVTSAAAKAANEQLTRHRNELLVLAATLTFVVAAAAIAFAVLLA
jgi:hypothetical protein